MKPAAREAFFRRLAAADPEPKTELGYDTPFQLLIAVILSAQATDKSVNLATGPLFRDAPTPQAIAALGEEKLIGYIKTIGLFRTKAKNVIATARLIFEKHGGEVPNDRAALERDWTPEDGAMNPFLHLSLHLAIEEQLSIDQPPGIRAAFESRLRQDGDRHAALHALLECLGEMLWQAQRDRRPPDGVAYLDCIRRRA
jgi:hypothetical protein